MRISGRIDPLLYSSSFASESECDEIRQRCADKDVDAVSINCNMLSMWRNRKGPEATYQALIEIFQAMNNEKMADLITEYAAEKIHSPCSHEYQDSKLNDKILELVEKNAKIKEKFAFLSVKIIKSLEKTEKPKQLAAYLSIFCHVQFEPTDDITDIILKTSSWFNIKVLKNVVDRFGSHEDKQGLSHYERDLLTYLQQSLLHIPSESFQSSNDTSEVTICYLKLPDEDVEMLDLSGEDVLQIERNLAVYLEIPHEVFNLCEYRLGCIELVFSIPTTLYKSSSMLQQSTVPCEFQNELRLIIQPKDIL